MGSQMIASTSIAELYQSLLNPRKDDKKICFIVSLLFMVKRTESNSARAKTIEEHLFFFPFILTKKRGRKQSIKIKTPDYWFLGIEKKELAS